MNNKHTVIAPIIDTRDGLSMIETSVVTNDNHRIGYFYVDTGASISIIDNNLVKSTGEDSSFCALGANDNNSQLSIVDFHIGKVAYRMNFHAVDKKLIPQEEGKVIVGILGIDFLKKNKCIIDFKKSALYINIKKENPKKTIEINYDESGIPLIMINGGKGPMPCLLDTGSDSNIMSQGALVNGSFTFSLTNKTDLLYGLGYKIKSTSAVVCFFNEGMGDGHFEEEFQIPTDEANAMLNIGKNKKVEIIIGSNFMKKNQWVLDFANSIIYRKAKE